LVLAAARTLWFIDQVERGMTFTLCRYRPWYRQKAAPSQLDVAEACREALHEAGIFPILHIPHPFSRVYEGFSGSVLKRNLESHREPCESVSLCCFLMSSYRCGSV
jgi:hypothetical protein